MSRLGKILATTTLVLSSQVALAAPSFLITHNHTAFESNAFIDGAPKGSPYPTKAYADNSVSWLAVRMACIGHTTNNKCNALIKMATNTPDVVTLGWLEMDLVSGEINPKEVQGNGYTLTVNGPGEVTLSQDQ